MKKPFYISTAIAYSSAIPHIGNVYETILADAIARFKRLDGYNVYFQTGTDEHGQKIELNAKLDEVTPRVYVDQISKEIQRIYDEMNISYDYFIKTTDETHQKAVQAIFKQLYDQGDIYLGKYEGWYSIAEESFVLEKDIVDGKSPMGDPVVWTSEEVYFFKMSKYQQQLVDHIKKNPNYIMPESRKNEMLHNFLNEKLPDLSVSRTSFKWGIPVTFDKNHVVYVWIDALSNYISSLGYLPGKEMTEKFETFWPADIHLIGKDIMRFHSIYWSLMLIALGIELPKTIFGHPWVLVDRNKMSKSIGNTMYVDELLKHFTVDIIRYYVLHEIPYQQDGNITYELIIERSNSDLTNTIGNLVNRTIGMANKYRDGVIKNVDIKEPFEYDLTVEAKKVLDKMRKLMETYHVGDSLEQVLVLARMANKYIDISMPWVLFKDETKQEELDYVLSKLYQAIRHIAILLQPFIPETAIKISKQMNFDLVDFNSFNDFSFDEVKLNEPEILFERYDLEKKMKEILE